MYYLSRPLRENLHGDSLNLPFSRSGSLQVYFLKENHDILPKGKYK